MVIRAGPIFLNNSPGLFVFKLSTHLIFPVSAVSTRSLENWDTCGRGVSRWRDRDLLRDEAFRRGFKMAVGEFFFTPLVLFIVPKYCHDEFFVNLNFFHGI